MTTTFNDTTRAFFNRVIGDGSTQIRSDDDLKAELNVAGDADPFQWPGSVDATSLDATVASNVTTPGTATYKVTEGRYRRVLSELKALAPGADIRPTVRAAIQAASGGSAAELVIPEGDWNLLSAQDAAASLLVDVPNVILRGCGVDKTRILSSISRNSIEVRGTSGAPVAGVQISDMTLLGGGSASTTLGNQTLLAANYTSGLRLRRISAGQSGLNSYTIFNSSDGLTEDLEAYDARSFSMLVYRSSNINVVDLNAHDFTSAAGSHLGLQFKSSKYCTSNRLRVRNIAGYGFYSWNDGLDLVNYPSLGCALIDPVILDLATGGSFAATAVYISEDRKFSMRGGRISSANGSAISVTNSDVSIASVGHIQSAGPAIGISGTSSFRVNDVHANGDGIYNPIGVIVSGTPAYGSIRNSTFINGTAGGSTDNAACRLESTVSGIFVEHNDFSDYQTTKTQRRGIYDRTAAGVNYWRYNRAAGNTSQNKLIPAGSEDTGNILV